MNTTGRQREGKELFSRDSAGGPLFSRERGYREFVRPEQLFGDDALPPVRLGVQQPADDAGQSPHDLGLAAVVESKKPGYTRDAMDNAAAFPAVARTLSDRQLEELVEKGEVAAAVLKERGKTDPTAAEPRPELSPSQVAAVIEDSTLGRLQARFEKRLREIELPGGGFTTKAQATAAHRLSQTFWHLQERQRKLLLPVMEKPERVKKAEAMESAYHRSHDDTGAPIPVRPRGRPSRSPKPADSPPPN